MASSDNPGTPTHPRWRQRAFILIITALLLIYLLSYVDWGYLATSLQNLSPLAMLGAFLLYVLLNAFRIMRYQALLPDIHLPIQTFLPIGLWHNFLVRILPFKLGEFAYPYYTHRFFDLPVTSAMSSLLGSRLLELLVIVLVLMLALIATGSTAIGQGITFWLLAIGIIVFGLLGFYFAGTILRSILRPLRQLSQNTTLGKIYSKLYDFAQALDRLHEPRIFWRGILWSCFTYASSFGVNLILILGIGIEIPFATLAIIVSIGMFATAFPFSISGFGMIELGWAFGLTTLAGFTLPEATAIGFLLNGFQIICALISGLGGYIILQQGARRSTLNNHEGR
jgi:uncharacterized membrane protein YbhN (UPF0104 family)